MNSSLVSQCLAFCQTLANQGKDFSFNLTINSSFSFSLDTRESKVSSTLGKKRTSPSTQRRNARRREEFLRKKLNFSSVSSSASDSHADTSPSATTVATIVAAADATSTSASSEPVEAPVSPPAETAKVLHRLDCGRGTAERCGFTCPWGRGSQKNCVKHGQSLSDAT